MKVKLCIDAGHGLGNVKPDVYDPGAVSAGVSEADIVLAFALTIKWLGQQRGREVFLTRSSEHEITPVGKRDDEARAAGCDLFISLHCNAGGPGASGTETFYRDAADRDLADRVNTAVVLALGTRDRGAKPESKTQHKRLAVLDFPGPACLLELGFITNARERELLLQRSSRLAVAEALLRVVERYDTP